MWRSHHARCVLEHLLVAQNMAAQVPCPSLQIDGSFGFEMETFEFLNLLQVGGGSRQGARIVGWENKGASGLFTYPTCYARLTCFTHHGSLLHKVHGFPKVMGVLTHLDSFTDQKVLKKTKKRLKVGSWNGSRYGWLASTEVCQ